MVYDTSIPTYNKFRLSLDAANLTGSPRFVGVIIDEYLLKYVIGQWALMTDINAISGDYENATLIVDAANEAIVTYDICELVAQCIRDNPNTRDAIRELLIEEEGERGTPASRGGNSSSLSQVIVDKCNRDNFFASITGVVDLLNTIIVDIFERIELSTTALERVSIIIDAIPILAVTPADEILEFADNELENLAQSYDASYTVQLRDEYRCDLFCSFQDDCVIDFEQLASYFATRAQTDFSNLTWEEAFAYFLTGSAQGDAVSHAAHYLVCLALSFGSRAIGFSASSVSSIVRALSNDSDADWQALCDCVEAPCYEYNFGNGNGGWLREQGAYNSPGGYWRTAGNINNNDAILKSFRVTLPSSRVVKRVEIDYEVESRNGIGATYIRWIDASTDGVIDEVVPQQGGIKTYASISVAINTDEIEFSVRAGDRIGEGLNQIRVYAVRVFCSD